MHGTSLLKECHFLPNETPKCVNHKGLGHQINAFFNACKITVNQYFLNMHLCFFIYFLGCIAAVKININIWLVNSEMCTQNSIWLSISSSVHCPAAHLTQENPPSCLFRCLGRFLEQCSGSRPGFGVSFTVIGGFLNDPTWKLRALKRVF